MPQPKKTNTSAKPKNVAAKKPKATKMLRQSKAELAASRKPMLSAPKLFARACKLLTGNWKLFLGILFIYALFNIILIGGFSGGNIETLKHNLDQVFTGNAGQWSGGLALFGLLLRAPNNNSSATASTYQGFLLLVISLALIWAYRQLYAGHKIRVRDAFYRGMYPIIPFMLVLLAVGLQLVPAIVGGYLYNTVTNGAVAAFGIEKVIWATIFFLTGVASLYMICSSIFALYIVTLPDMTPMKALRTARELVRYRRLRVLAKLLFMPLALIICIAIIMVPVIILITPAATGIFFVLTIVSVAIFHSYMYGLYRELIA